MDEYIVSGRALDKAVAFRSVEPFHCTFLFHSLSPEYCAGFGDGPKKKKPRDRRDKPGSVALLLTAKTDTIVYCVQQYRTGSCARSSVWVPKRWPCETTDCAPKGPSPSACGRPRPSRRDLP